MEEIEVKEKGKKHIVISIFILIIILIGSTISYARYVGTTGLVINEKGIINNDLPSSFNGLKIVAFSDIHYGKTTSLKDIKKVVKNINKLKPDIVIFLGDLFDNEIKINTKDVDNLKNEIAKIDSKLAKYAVKGDSDYKNITNFENIFKYADFNILDNSNDYLYYKGTVPLKFVGTTSLLKSKIDYETAFKQEDENEYFTILLSHEPNVINELKENKVNMMFAGHSMGGLINVPFVGGIIKFEGSNNYLQGEYQVKYTNLYVSTGIGTYKYNFRWCNIPRIDLYRIYNN